MLQQKFSIARGYWCQLKVGVSPQIYVSHNNDVMCEVPDLTFSRNWDMALYFGEEQEKV
jgi:hypothetical protein